MSECYVCYEPCETLSECLCKGLYIHPSCLEMMKIYGKEVCGVCRTPFPEEEIEWNVAPCYCLFLPTCFRPIEYDYTEQDRAFDIVRITFVFVCALVIYHLSLTGFQIDSADYVIFAVGLLAISFCCIGIGKALQTPPHNLDLPLDHDIEFA